jgi:uncharacterized Fe-S cluster-containing radical SAM superfamily protein
MNSSFIDPLVMAEKIGSIVSAAEKRKYYRFRPAPFYGGIATADCVGCCLKCLFCCRGERGTLFTLFTSQMS